jgi:hypothetical protein
MKHRTQIQTRILIDKACEYLCLSIISVWRFSADGRSEMAGIRSQCEAPLFHEVHQEFIGWPIENVNNERGFQGFDFDNQIRCDAIQGTPVLFLLGQH